MLYYNANIDLNQYPIGTVVDVEGQVYIYNRGYELKDDAMLNIVGTEDFTYPDPVEYTGEMIMDTCVSDNFIEVEYVSMEGTLVISGNYYNLEVDGDYYMASIYWPTDELKDILENGKSYKIIGYLTAVTSQRYLNVMVTEIYPLSESETFVSYGIIYSGSNGKCSIIGYTNNLSGDVIIPSVVYNGDTPFTVTSIEDHAFANCHAISSIILPSSVTSIGFESFYFCDALKSIELTAVENISDYSFYRCLSLNTINIPSTTKNIGLGCFRWCPGLNEINVNEDNIYYTSLDGVLFDKNISTLLACPGAKSGEYSIPATVENIYSFAFDNCLKLEKVFIPGNVNEIGNSPFYYCTSLEAIEVDPLNDFYQSIDGVLYSHDMTQIIQCPGSRTEGLELPSSVKSINYGCFAGCLNLSSIDLGNTLEYIGSYGLAYCNSLETLTIPESVTKIDAYALRYNTSLKTLDLPQNLETIPVGLCSESNSLSNVKIGSNTKIISSGAFYSCPSLFSIELPENVSYIGGLTFDKCENLLSIKSKNLVPPIIYSNTFCTYENATLYVDETAIQDYKDAPYWQNFQQIQSLENAGVKEIFSKSDDNLIIYDLQGRKRYNGDSKSLDNLPKGIYIIKGKKVILGK